MRRELRRLFERWGRPRRIRVDNGKPWGTSGDLPPPLALWLIGLGIEVIWNTPRRPQENGVVERSQGTAKRWAEPHACRDPAELQARLDADDQRQRERYPVVGELSRWELFPGLAHSGRPYREAEEDGVWNLQRARDQLAGLAAARRVDSQGKISIYNKNLYVGSRLASQRVWVQFDPELGEWLITNDAGQQLRTRPAPEISEESLRGPCLTGRERHPPPKRAAKLRMSGSKAKPTVG